MTVANRAIGAPINIWNDHSDAMSQRDSGWVQLYAEDNQEAADLHIQAFRLGEMLSLPVMVCMDGFVLTHAYERIETPDRAAVDAYLPPFEPRQLLDPDNPVSIGAMVGPEAFEEVRYLAHMRHLEALEAIPRISNEFAQAFGRASGGLVKPYRLDGASTVVVALGSVLGTIKDTVDAMRDRGIDIGVLGISSYRPFPSDAVVDAVRHARRVVVVDRALAPASGGVVGIDVRTSLAARDTRVYDVVAGLGGRPITIASLTSLFEQAIDDHLEPLTFLDLDLGLLERDHATRA
jgi:pyruvate ferredoxin oxidoreductase alpha subunit